MGTTTYNNLQTVSQTDDRNQRVTLWRVLGGILIFAVIALYINLFIQAIDFRNQPFAGFFLTQTMTVNAGLPTSHTEWSGIEAGLQANDHVIAIDGESLGANPDDYDGARLDYNDIVNRKAPGDTITITFERRERNGVIVDYCGEAVNGIAVCEVTATLDELNAGDFFVFFILPFASGLIILAIGLAAWQLRGETLHGFLTVLITMFSAVYTGAIFDAGVSQQFIAIWILSASGLSGALLSMGISFPTPITTVRNNRNLIFMPVIISLVLGVVLIYLGQNPASPWDNQSTQYTTVLGIAGLVTFFVLLVTYQRKQAVTTQLRDQNNTVLIGTTLMLFPSALWFINRFLLSNSNINLGITFESLMPLYIFPNAAIVYAILQYRRIDTDRIISQSFTYAIMILALIVSNFLLVLGLNFIVQDLIEANHPLLNASILFIMVALFIPVRNHLQQRIDAIYYRTRRNYQQKQELFANQLTTSSSYADISASFVNILKETLNAGSVFIYLSPNEDSHYTTYRMGEQDTDLAFSPRSETVRALRESDEAILLPLDQAWDARLMPDRNRLKLLKAMALAPMPGTRRLNGFVVVGVPTSGKKAYDYEEMRFINSMVGQLAIATERSQVIDSLENRVRELNVLSQVGQAVNFTIDFDDLLELIYAQTSKLIDSACFYIVLYEESIQQLFFAFYLEEDDRITERENIRWLLKDDLYSEVIKTSKALKLADYAREKLLKGEIPNIKMKEIHAWMGVPLTSGRSTVGVIAVGKSETGETYSEEQFKIFNDIGALAATSIEKARLFSETKVRERQLTVLNDISRQLVATESDVEKLLEIIMASAVEILTAEAGSLLLTTEDGSGDLEFRVVIGGAGEELVGKRWEADKGIVGQVMSTGKARIVNDAKQDPQHIQDTKDTEAIESFSTDSLLAVPLIAKDNIIGVLEVLNKLDGTPFVEADVNLLTTFAGQAAVAIENARLFRMTDIQLSQRVEELEILENFDNKLNRTLNLNDVANITVTTAVKTLNATAGALGIYHEQDNVLEIVAMEGYEEADYPEGADGIFWPADKGIVRRVIRNRQPDIATDVSIDPDYAPAVRNSLSQLTIPMMSGAELNAILILEKTEEPRFSLTDWSFGQRLSEHASIAIANAQLYQELMVANKSKSEFMGFAAHELKNPLSSVKGYSDLMLKGMLGDISEKQRNFINVIYSNANRMETIINDLRDSAKMDANEFNVEVAPMHIHHAVIETLRPFTHILEEKQQTLVNKVRDDLPLVMGDQTRLIQVLTNLVSNAHKYSPEGTSITLDAVIDDNFVNKQGIKRGRMLKLSVRDEGIGMSVEDQERLFKERYFRSTNPDALDQPGTGLGMMLTHGIVEKHQGDIWIESELGKGSAFILALPLASQESPAPTPEAGSD